MSKWIKENLVTYLLLSLLVVIFVICFTGPIYLLLRGMFR